MTWKRCAGCSRALSATAFTCDYCGHVCEDATDFLPEKETAPRSQPADDVDDFSAGFLDLPGEDHVRHADTAALIKPVPPADDPFAAFDDDAATPEPALPFEQAPELHIAPQQVPESATGKVPPAARVANVPPTGTQSGIGPRQLAMAGAGVVAAAALIFTILGMRGAASPEPVATTPTPRPVNPGTAPRPKPAAPAAAPARAAVAPAADAPHWERVTDGRWVNANKHNAAFEVAATNRTHIWTRDVTPILVVRCQSGIAEAFVYTQSAARMEPQDGDHTVRFAFDANAEVSERWPDSAEHDALFARNHAAFMTTLAQSRTLRFGYTPHNADPVTATFVVDGLSELLASSARQCGVHQ